MRIVALIVLVAILQVVSNARAQCVLVTDSSGLQDWSSRDLLPQTDVNVSLWKTCCGSWGPWAKSYPFEGSTDVAWLRDRVVASGIHWSWLRYWHHHIPNFNGTGGNETTGLDCSNWSAWVYNFGIGRVFTSNVVDQSNIPTFQRIDSLGKLEQGDLVFFTDDARTGITHSGIFCWTNRSKESFGVMNSHDTGVRVSTSLTSWPLTRFSHGLRVIQSQSSSTTTSTSVTSSANVNSPLFTFW